MQNRGSDNSMDSPMWPEIMRTEGLRYVVSIMVGVVSWESSMKIPIK